MSIVNKSTDLMHMGIGEEIHFGFVPAASSWRHLRVITFSRSKSSELGFGGGKPQLRPQGEPTAGRLAYFESGR